MNSKLKLLYRKPDEALILGVCAGISDFSGIPVNLIRFFWVASVLFFFPLFFLYFFLGLVLKKDPNARSLQNLPNPQAVHEEIEALDRHFEQLRKKVGRIEHYVTSDEFSFQRKLWDLRE